MRTLDFYSRNALQSLKLGLDARLLAIDAEYGDFELERPDQDEGYLDVIQEPVVRVPIVEAVVPDFDLFNPSVGQHHYDGANIVMVQVWYEHPDPTTFTRAVYRYLRAVMEVLLQPDAFGPGVTVTRARGAVRQNPEVGQIAEFAGGALVSFTIDTTEVI